MLFWTGLQLILPVIAGFPIGIVHGASLFYLSLSLCGVTRADSHVMMSHREIRHLV